MDITSGKIFLKGILKQYKDIGLFKKYETFNYIISKSLHYEISRLAELTNQLNVNLIDQIVNYYKITIEKISMHRTKKKLIHYLNMDIMYNMITSSFNEYQHNNNYSTTVEDFNTSFNQNESFDLVTLKNDVDSLLKEDIEDLSINPAYVELGKLEEDLPFLKEHDKMVEIISIIKNIYWLIIVAIIGYIIKEKEEVEHELTLKKEEIKRVVIFPRMRRMKVPLFELYKLTNHVFEIRKYFGKHFGAFSTYTFGLFGFCLKRGKGMSRRFLKIYLTYLGFIDPYLWETISHQYMEEPTTYDMFSLPQKMNETEIKEFIDTKELFKLWINNSSIYNNVIEKLKLFCETFLDTVDFLPVDFQEKSYTYSNYRNKVGQTLKHITDDFFENNELSRRHLKLMVTNGMEDIPYIVQELWRSDEEVDAEVVNPVPIVLGEEQQEIIDPFNKEVTEIKKKSTFFKVKKDGANDPKVEYTEFPDPTKRITIINRITLGYTYFDVYKMSSDLLFWIESLYNFSGDASIDKDKKWMWSVGFENFDDIIKKHLTIDKETPVNGKYKDITTLITQLNESQNLALILETLYTKIKHKGWNFTDTFKHDEEFKNIFVKNQYVMMTIVMICNIVDNIGEEMNIQNSKIIDSLLTLNSVNWTGTTVKKDESVEKFCLEVMKILYNKSIYRTKPKVYKYSYYLATQTILKWFIRSIFIIIDLWDDNVFNNRLKPDDMDISTNAKYKPKIIQKKPKKKFTQKETSVKLYRDLEKINVYENGREVLINNSRNFVHYFPKFQKWNDAKTIKIYAFSHKQNYLFEDLYPSSLLFLFKTKKPFSDELIYQGNSKIFKYNIPRDLLITKSLTVKSGREKIFNRTELFKLRSSLSRLIIKSEFYLDIMKKNGISIQNEIGYTLKVFISWSKSFSKKFLNQDLSHEISKYNSLMDLPTDHHYNDTMKKLKKSLIIIIEIFKKKFGEINLNNRKLYFTFINYCFNTSSLDENPIKNTNIISQITAAKTLTNIHIINNRELLKYMNEFKNYHTDYKNYIISLKNKPPFILAASFMYGRETITNNPSNLLTDIYKRDGFGYYKKFLYWFKLINIEDINFPIDNIGVTDTLSTILNGEVEDI